MATNMSRLAEQSTEPVGTPQGNRSGALANRVPVDIYEDGEGITLQADMPGVSKERLNVHVEGDSLLLEGQAQFDLADQARALHADVRSSTYRRSFILSRELETDRIEANLKDGVLTVRIPKRAQAKPRKIAVQSV